MNAFTIKEHSKSKFNKLNFNLKNIIFTYQPIEESFNSIFNCNKSFKCAFKKLKIFKLMIESGKLRIIIAEFPIRTLSFMEEILLNWENYLESFEDAQNLLVRMLSKSYAGKLELSLNRQQKLTNIDDIYNKFLSQSKSIKTIKLQEFNFSNEDDFYFLRDFKQIFIKNKNIEAILFEESLINNEGFNRSKTLSVLGEIIKLCPQLSKLSIPSSNMGLLGFKFITKNLANDEENFMRNLTYLNLRDNEMHDIAMKAFVKLNFENLEYLDLSKNQILDQQMKSLALMQLPKLKVLRLDENDFDVRGMNYMASMRLENLIFLDLGRNGIGDQGVKALSSMRFPHLRALNLSFNDIHAQGIKHLRDINTRELEFLFLGDNEINTEAMLNLSKIKFPKLIELSLACNKFGSEGMKLLGNIDFPKLVGLDVSKNDISDEGIECLVKAQMPKLAYIVMHGNAIEKEGISYLNNMGVSAEETLSFNFSEYYEYK